jgi:hypothetical protein
VDPREVLHRRSAMRAFQHIDGEHSAHQFGARVVLAIVER